VKVGVEVVGDEEVVVEELAGGFVDDEFLVEAVAVRCGVIGLGDILECHRLRAVGRTNPV